MTAHVTGRAPPVTPEDRLYRIVEDGMCIGCGLALVCGRFMPPHGMDRFLREREGLDPDRLTALRYRGHGCPGRMRYELDDGTRKEFRYTDFSCTRRFAHRVRERAEDHA